MKFVIPVWVIVVSAIAFVVLRKRRDDKNTSGGDVIKDRVIVLNPPDKGNVGAELSRDEAKRFQIDKELSGDKGSSGEVIVKHHGGDAVQPSSKMLIPPKGDNGAGRLPKVKGTIAFPYEHQVKFGAPYRAVRKFVLKQDRRKNPKSGMLRFV